jgi:hypothetical protein
LPFATKRRPVEEAAPKTISIEYLPWAKQKDDGTWIGQAVVHKSEAKFREVMAGRQSGKTMVGIAEICVDAMSAKHVDWWICPNYKVKPRAWRGLLAFLPKEVIVKKNETENYIQLVNGSEIRVTSADAEGSLVSESLDFAVCDEAGQWKEKAWYQGIAPMFAARPDAKALLIGTPRGKNWFHRLWLKGQAGHDKDPEHESFHWKSEDSPYVSKSFLEEQRRNIPQDTYLQEYEANPLDNASAVFRNFRHCIRNWPMVPDQFMCLGVDLARKIDFTAVVAMNGKKQVTEIQRFQEDWPDQKRRIVSTAFRLNSARGVVDSTGEGDVLVGFLREAGMQVEEFVLSNQSKQKLLDNLRVDFEQSLISIPNDTDLIAELDAYQYEFDEETRKMKFSAPEGMHDDLVIALALASWGQRGVSSWVVDQTQTGSYMGRSSGGSYMRR